MFNFVINAFCSFQYSPLRIHEYHLVSLFIQLNIPKICIVHPLENRHDTKFAENCKFIQDIGYNIAVQNLKLLYK